MAAVQRNSEGQDYRFAEKNLQTGVVDVYGKMDKSMQMFRPALADKHKVGFFSQDRTSQTDVTEVIDLKQMTKVLKNVLADVDVLKREIVLSKNIIQADYEARLRTKAIELYSRVNERMSQVEKLSDERIDSIRRAYRQQLSNAIHRLKAIYTAEMEKKIEEIKREKLGDAASLLDKYNELHLTNERNKSVIEMLRMQLNEAAIRPVHVPEVKKEEPVYNTQFDEEKEEELDNLRDEVRDLENKIERLMEELDVKDEEASELKMDIDNLKDALEKEKIFNQQLRYENEEMKNAHDQEKMASKRQFSTGLGLTANEAQHRGTTGHQRARRGKLNNRPVLPHLGLNPSSNRLAADLSSDGSVASPYPDPELAPDPSEQTPLTQRSQADPPHTTNTQHHTDMEKQRLEMEREMLNKMQRKMKEMSENAAGNLKSLQEAEKNKINLLTKQNQELQELLAAEREKASNKSKEEMDMEAARRREKAMSAEILKLKKEIERIHKSWEKKFGILQASLHALKDESYVRQSLQRQAATLHHAAISYAVDAPLGIQPSKQTPRKFPLPNIPPSGRSTKRDGEYYPHTVSANSARYHSVDENQVVSDPEDVPADMAPLPDPPHSFRPVSSSGDDNIRPSSSNVVVVPSPLQAQ